MKMTPVMVAFVEEKLRLGWSPQLNPDRNIPEADARVYIFCPALSYADR